MEGMFGLVNVQVLTGLMLKLWTGHGVRCWTLHQAAVSVRVEKFILLLLQSLHFSLPKE